jgi:ribose transport system substrate-binding protein
MKRKSIKIIVLVFLAVAVGFFFAGCEKEAEKATGGKTEEETTADESKDAAEGKTEASGKEVEYERELDPFTELPVLNPMEYLQYMGESHTDVDFNPAMEAESLNTPMTPSWETKSPPWKLGYSEITIHNPWRMTVMREALYEAEKHPEIEEIFQLEAGGDINKQISDIENLVAKDVDALIISPGSPGALVPVIEKAYDMGIPVIIFHGRIETEKFTCSIQPDEYGFGWLFGDWLGEQLNGEGEVIGIKGLPGYKPAIDRWAGAVAGISQYPDIEIIAEEFGHWSPVEGKKAATSLLAAHPDFDGILSIDPWATAAILELMDTQGREMVPTTGFEENSSFAAWIEYDVKGIGAYEPTWLAGEAVKAAIKILQGEPVKKRYLTRVPVVTEEGRDKLYREDMPPSYYPGSHLPEEIIQEIF